MATEQLLDVLERAVDRSARARTLQILESIGPPVAPAAAARLKDAPWFVQRNLLVLLRRLMLAEETSAAAATARVQARVEPAAVLGVDFFSGRRSDLQTLAEQQGVQPVTDFDDLLGDFWPEDETADQFIAAVRQWRRQSSGFLRGRRLTPPA